MSDSESFGKKLLLSIIPLFLGSFIFIGVIENYKKDSNLKIQILEKYYKPSRQLVADCQKKNNDLFLAYRKPPRHLRLFSEEMIHLLNNPSLNANRNYGQLLEALAKTYQDSTNELKKMEKEVETCKVEVFRSLETLSIATGCFEEFSEFSAQRSKKLNEIYGLRSDRSKKNTQEANMIDPKDLLRDIATVKIKSKEDGEKFKAIVNKMLPVIERHGEIMSQTEESVFKVEGEFYSKIRNETSEKLNELFKEGFFGWIF